MSRFKPLLCFATALLPAAGCSVGPDYKRPAQSMPDAYASTQPAPTSRPTLRRDWWTVFNDPALSALEQSAMANNPNLAAAAARVRQARATVRYDKADFYPTIAFDPAFERTRSGNSRIVTGGTGASIIGSGTTSTGTGTTGSQSVSSGRTSNSYRIPFDLSYEVDIWGRVRRTVEAAQATADSSAADFEVVLQTLEADVATDYFSIRSLVDQERIVQQTVTSYRRELQLTQQQQRAGLVGQTDVAQAQAQLDSTQTQSLELERQRIDLEHALAILLGQVPGETELFSQPLIAPPPTIPFGLPSELLRVRPDVVEAEQNLRAANAQIGVAKALFYPQLSLTGLAGFESSDLRHSLDWENRIWSVGTDISQPLFEGGRLVANVEQAKARYAELSSTYRNTVLSAIRDVEDSLTDLHFRADEAVAQERAVGSSREYLRLSDLQYHQGLIGYLQVIDAERTLLTNELSAAQILNQRMTSTILLVKALGGGWDPIPRATTRQAAN